MEEGSSEGKLRRGESGGGTAYGFGVENPTAFVSAESALPLQGDRQAVGFGQSPQQDPASFVNAASNFSGPHLGSSILPAITDTYGLQSRSNSIACHGFSYHSTDNPNSASNMRGPTGCSNSAPSSILPLQMENFPVSLTNNFYIGSGLSCGSSVVPTSGHTLVSPRVSSMNIFNINHLNVENIYKQKGFMCKMNNDLTPSTESDSSRKLQMPRRATTSSFLQEFDDEFKDTELKLVLRKELSNSDVGNIGRIVLPKKGAEANLPLLADGDGIILHMDDIVFPVTWKFKYRFWPNNKSRMYIMEGTGDFVRTHGLQTGDCFIIYRSSASGNYVVRGMKRIQRSTQVPVVHCNRVNEGNMNADCCNEKWK